MAKRDEPGIVVVRGCMMNLVEEEGEGEEEGEEEEEVEEAEEGKKGKTEGFFNPMANCRSLTSTPLFSYSICL